MKKITKENTGLVLILVALLTNPLSGAYIMQAVDWAFQEAFTYIGAIATGIAGVYVVGLIIYYNYKSSRINIPKKPKKAHKAQYIET